MIMIMPMNTPTTMTLSEGGAAQIQRREGLGVEYARTGKIIAYLDSGVPAIGYGHRGDDVTINDVINRRAITLEKAKRIFLKDAKRFEDAIRKGVKVPLTQGQFDALLSLTYNIGTGNFQKSTLLKKLNQGDYEGAARQFVAWRRSRGKVLPGLLKRRELETKIFRGELRPEDAD